MIHRYKDRLIQFFTFSLLINFLSLRIFPSFRHLISKTLDFLNTSMDYLFSSTEIDDLLFVDRAINSIEQFSDPHDEKLYLVDRRWWNETGDSLLNEIEGVLYPTTSCLSDDFDSDIIMEMRSINENGGDAKGEEEGSLECEYALISEWMFYRALKWYNQIKNAGRFSAGEHNRPDIFSLQVRLSISDITNSLVVRIRRKDNEIGAFNKSCKIFSLKSGLLHIWDFSGQMTKFFLRGRKSSDDFERPNEEISMELHVYGLSSGMMQKENGMAAEDPEVDGFPSSNSLKMNGNSDNVTASVGHGPQPSTSSFSEAFNLGLTGLSNLGNTCFMNSAIQCLAHTPQLVDYFLGDFRKDLNSENPLGMSGKLALAFGDLLRQLWAPGATSVAPEFFKTRLASFAPQFSGYNQHDSQEFLSFLLDGLHEDLNRVKSKPYIEVKEADGFPDKEVADEHWWNHLARNDSIIVDMCQGQYRSTLICPLCKKQSVTFDPFMYLSLPLPSTTMRTMTLTVLSTDGTSLPVSINVTVPKYGRFEDLIQALTSACSLGDDETLLVAEIFNNYILQFLDKPCDSLGLIRDHDRLVAYRLPKDKDGLPLVVFTHRQMEGQFPEYSALKKFGIPLVARIPESSDGNEIRNKFLELLNPFLIPDECSLDDLEDSLNNTNQDTEMVENSDIDIEASANDDFQFYQETAGTFSEESKIAMDEALLLPAYSQLSVLVTWPEEMLKRCDSYLMDNLPDVSGPSYFAKNPPESVSLYKCLEAFLKEEPLGPDDMWYCPTCKKHQQASKKLDLWRLPEILVIHLKRFSHTRFLTDKLETFVDFPIDDFDLSNYTIHKNTQCSYRYELYAISNHYGAMGGGHYTAFVKCGEWWYEFDDSRVIPIEEAQVKTSAAYVLFYRRISESEV